MRPLRPRSGRERPAESARKAQLVRAPAIRAPTIPGASPYASGFHVCMGANPIFVPYPTTSSTKAACSQGFENPGALRTRSSNSSEGSPPAWTAAYPRKNEPRRASAIPTEPTIRYFHVASRDASISIEIEQRTAGQRGGLQGDPHEAEMVGPHDEGHHSQEEHQTRAEDAVWPLGPLRADSRHHRPRPRQRACSRGAAPAARADRASATAPRSAGGTPRQRRSSRPDGPPPRRAARAAGFAPSAMRTQSGRRPRGREYRAARESWLSPSGWRAVRC